MSQSVTSTDISVLDFSVLLDMAVAQPTVTFNNLSTVSTPGNLQWIFEVYTPSGGTVHKSAFDVPDFDGTAWTTFTIAETLPLIFGQLEFNSTNPYLFKVSVKDDAGQIFTESHGVTICKPNGNNGKNNMGAAAITAEVKCGTAQIYITDKTNLVYKSLTGTRVDTEVTLTYPIDSNGNTLAAVTVHSVPALLPIKYEGEGHNIYVAYVIDYDMGDNVTVRIRYYYSYTFPVWCNITLYPLFCEIAKITDYMWQNCQEDNVENREKQRKLTMANAKMLQAHTGIVFPLMGFDVPRIVEDIKKILNVECECCRPAGISNVGSVAFSDAVLTVNKVCGDMLLSWEVDEGGNYVLTYQNLVVVMAIASDSESDAFTYNSSTSGCTKTISLKVDMSTLAQEILTEIYNNQTLLDLLNDITQRAQLTCFGLNGYDIYNSSTCDYTVQLNTSVVGSVLTNVFIDNVQFDAPGSLLLTNAAGISTWLAGLGQGTFVVNYDNTSKRTTITTNNTHTFNTVTVTVIGQQRKYLVTNNCGLICNIIQAIFNYLNTIRLAQIKAGADIAICKFGPGGVIQTNTYGADNSALDVALALAEAVCNITTYLSTRVLSCENLKTAFAAYTPAAGIPVGADILLFFKNGACQQVPLNIAALSIFQLAQTDATVKAAFCAITPCDSVPTCVAPTIIYNAGTDTTWNITWSAVAGATRYKWSIDNVNWFSVVTTAAYITGLTINTAYVFRVYPVYTSGDGVDCTTTANFTTTNTSGTCEAPDNLISEAVTSSSFRITWDAVTGASGYQYRINGGPWINNGTSRLAIISGLLAATEYNYEVRAIIGGNPCAETASDSVTTDAVFSNGTVTIADCDNSEVITNVSFNAVTAAGAYPINEGNTSVIAAANPAINGSLTVTITSHTGGTTSRLDVVDSLGAEQCQSIAANGVFTFPNFTISEGVPFTIDVICGGGCP